ncbi:MAG: uracil-DNA glycosylase [Bryobacteraceae bacterium]
MTVTEVDLPKSLRNEAERERRMAALESPHVAGLNALVAQIRGETGRYENVPYFDPLDGGENAKCLFLMEAPGPKAVATGFISRNNPDETARNFFEFNLEARIPRQQTVLWNTVPWYIGSGTKIRSADRQDILAAGPYFERLFGALTRLEVVALMGDKAYSAKEEILKYLNPGIRIVRMKHPSPKYVNRRPGNRPLLKKQFDELAELLLPSD